MGKEVRTVGQMAQKLAESIYDRGGSPPRVRAADWYEKLWVRPKVLVLKGSEEELVPKSFRSDEEALKFGTDRMTPELSILAQIFYSTRFGAWLSGEKKEIKKVADFNKRARKGKIEVVIFDRHGRVEESIAA